jgi:hypothetical protein
MPARHGEEPDVERDFVEGRVVMALFLSAPSHPTLGKNVHKTHRRAKRAAISAGIDLDPQI